MKIVVCIRQGLDGEINPFDACAYEAALSIPGAEVTLLSMGPKTAEEFLLRLTRLGAREAVLLSDKAFAGADTLATAYTLGLAVRRLQPDVIFCGRQTLVGDTAQVGPMLSVFAGTSLITNVMAMRSLTGEGIVCDTRTGGERYAPLPALITVERINTLRLPSIRSKPGVVTVWDAATLGADTARTGLAGSPTRVVASFENQSGRRKCQFISRDELTDLIDNARKKEAARVTAATPADVRLPRVFIVGEAPREFAATVSDDVTVLPLDEATTLAARIAKKNPTAVLWGSDNRSKATAAQVAALLNVGLCADCTALETDGEQLIMYRPALSGSVIAKIVSHTPPAMATVRTADADVCDVVVTAGYGVAKDLERVRAFAAAIGAELAATRKVVDHGLLPYSAQVGLTGKTVAPPVYVALGVSGAVHHLVGMRAAGTVIAVNPDRNAPIFDYADYGVVGEF